MLKLDSRLSKTKDMPWKIIEKEAVLVDMDEGEVIRLNEIGAEIWQSIDGNNSVGDIINRIDGAFKADRNKIERDVFDFLKQLLRMEIIKAL